MLINLVPAFFAARAAPYPVEAYRRYLEEHRPVLASYWHNYILDLDSPHATAVMQRTLAADRRDLLALLDAHEIERLADDTIRRCEHVFEPDRPFDVYLMVGVGGANAGELVVGGRGIAFVCLEHFTGRPNPETLGLGLSPELLPLWIAHEIAHTVRYTSPDSQSEMADIVAATGGKYDYWETGSRASVRELMVNEGLAVAGAREAVPGFQVWDYLGYTRQQYRRVRQLEAFLKRATNDELNRRGLGYRLRYLSGGVPPAHRIVGGKVVPERTGYYLGLRFAEPAISEFGIARALRMEATACTDLEAGARGAQSA
jgi:hypothetical protein